MFRWLARLIVEPPVITPWNRAEIKKTLLMVGITPEQQQELFDLGLHMNEDNLRIGKRLTDEYERQGAKFVYIVDNGKLKRNPDAELVEDDNSQDARWQQGYEKHKRRKD